VSRGPFDGPGGTLDRRAMLASLARWSVPTVLTIALATRQAAAASCPPCTKKTGGRCQACSMNQILNCQCEPCLGAPYCSGAHAQAGLQGAQAAPLVRSPAPSSRFDLNQNPLAPSPFQASPFGRSLGSPRDSALSRGGLYERLRADQRRPF